MSHLSILPTVLRDAALLASCLEALGFQPSRGGVVKGFAGEREPVDLQVPVSRELILGWRQQPDGSLALVGDLQRLSHTTRVHDLLGRITRRYAAALALQEAERHFRGAEVSVGL
ncbi:MAG: DUF1257 domain-containing protein [Cyanobacteria bacterium M_surface_10_m2_119]|nr:DUF1257 domain-containing protein [Cyanobacteria bacterium M_surface_10_m2_119]